MQADIDLAAAFHSVHPQEQDLVGTAPGIRRSLYQCMQHVLPGGERRQHAAVERTADGLDAIAGRGVHIVGLFIEAAEQTLAQRGDRSGDTGQRAGEAVGCFGDARTKREYVAFKRPPTGLVSRGARQHLMADQAQEGLGGVGPAGVQPAQFGMVRADPAWPAGRRQRSRRLQCRVQRCFQQRTGGDQFLDPPPQAAGTRSSAFGAQQPAAHLRGLEARQFGREGAIGRIEHVVAFVEHVAGGHHAVVQPAPGGLGHHQCMVRHDKLCGACAADRVLDEAAPPVRAGGVDALAAPVREAEDGRGAEQLRQPTGQIAALDVAVVGHQRPARDQAKRDDRGRRPARGRRAQRVLQVQQAQVVLATLAHDDALVALGRIGKQVRQFGVDLALQVAGEGADPHAAVVLLRPQAGGRQVAERLAGPGAGLGQHEMRVAAGLARSERRRRGAGIVRLPRPLLGVRPKHVREPRPRLGLGHRQRRRRRQWRGILPLRQALPDAQRLARWGGSRAAERGGDERRPAPAGLPHARRQPRRIAVQRDVAALRQPVQQGDDKFRQQRRLGFQAAAWRFEVESQRQPPRGRRGGTSRQGEGEQLQQIECGHAPQAEPAKRGGCMHQQRRRQATKMGRGSRHRQQQQFAVGGEDRGTAVAGDDGRRVGQSDPRHGHRADEVTHIPLVAISRQRHC